MCVSGQLRYQSRGPFDECIYEVCLGVNVCVSERESVDFINERPLLNIYIVKRVRKSKEADRQWADRAPSKEWTNSIQVYFCIIIIIIIMDAIIPFIFLIGNWKIGKSSFGGGRAYSFKYRMIRPSPNVFFLLGIFEAPIFCVGVRNVLMCVFVFV